MKEIILYLAQGPWIQSTVMESCQQESEAGGHIAAPFGKQREKFWYSV